MKLAHTALLSLGLAWLPYAAQAEHTPVSVCVEALEQVETLQTVEATASRALASVHARSRQTVDDGKARGTHARR